MFLGVFFTLFCAPLLFAVRSKTDAICNPVEFTSHQYAVNKVLLNHAIRSITTDGDTACKITCHLNPDCISYNIGPTSLGLYLCQLNNADHRQYPLDFKNRAGHSYRKIKSKSCDSNPCFGNATCQEKNQGESFTCLCPRNYTGQKCEILLKKYTWVQANSAPVCIGTKNDTFGTFKARFTGKLKTIKLIHLSGGVAWSGGPNYEGNWGDNYSKKFEIHVTDENNNRIAPPSYYPYRYTLPGQNFMNKYLVFPDFNPALDVIPDKVFRIWYNEDLRNYSESDNSGTVCANIYLYFIKYY